MNADLDRLVDLTELHGDVPVSATTIRRIAADYAQVVAERDRWRAIADRLGEALDDYPSSSWTLVLADALDEWRAAKEDA